MEAQIERLVNKTWEAYRSLPPSKRLLIAIGGIPGSGKTTIAAKISSGFNEIYYRDSSDGSAARTGPVAAFIPMDGYHMTREQLSAMPDPKNAHARRGAEFTFNGQAYLELIKQLREPLLPDSHPLYAPSFDHALKDPKQDDIQIPTTIKVLIFEGLYVALDKEPWKTAAGLMDELWFVVVPFKTARERLVKRHVKTGVTADEKSADERVTENDLVNGQQIVENRLEVHEIIHSQEDKGWT